MPEAIVFVPAEGILGDTLETARYRACDECGESQSSDYMDGKPPRGFTTQHGGQWDGLTLCDSCFDRYLCEGPQ